MQRLAEEEDEEGLEDDGGDEVRIYLSALMKIWRSYVGVLAWLALSIAACLGALRLLPQDVEEDEEGVDLRDGERTPEMEVCQGAQPAP